MINNTLFVVLFNPLHLPIFDITLMLILKCGYECGKNECKIGDLPPGG